MLEIGSLIDGKYKILNKIGQGGMSTVYLAMNERANKQWAIKEVRKDGVADYEVVRQSLIVETDMLKQLSHPYLPSIVDVIEEQGRFLIVMDYIEGNTLSRALQEYGAQPQEYVIEWARQLCDVLGYLHTRKPPIIYRDLKPANIMLRPDGSITLIDFGTARTYKRENIEDTTCLGTRGYAAPEQFGGRGQTDARTDIYCLGTTLYHLVTGHNPCEPPYELYPIRHWNPALSQGLEKIIQKCTQLNPADRYQSCAELMYDLEHYQELDQSFHRSAAIRMGAFCTAAVLAIGCGIAAYGFHSAAKTIEVRSYDSYVEEAKGEVTVDRQVGTYGEAISLKPSDETAYLELLNNVYLADDNLSPEEDAQLRQLLITSYDGKNTYEQMLASNAQAYDDFAYRLGLAYFYCYDGSGNKPMASKWLTIAQNSETLSQNRKDRAQRLGRIADYYARIGRESKSGDATVSYADYWKDLKQITAGDIAKTDNSTTALMVYKEMVSQIYSNANNFKKDGITYEDMKAQLDNISKRLQTDITITDTSNADRINQLKDTLSANITLAQKTLDGAFHKQ